MKLTVADSTLTIETDRVDIPIEDKLERYMAGERVIFDESVNLEDFTAFQRRVLGEIRRIAYGESINYAELAERVGKPRAYRAVANACGANPVPIVIPCHRVVAKEGIGGYSGGVGVKRELLRIEGL